MKRDARTSFCGVVTHGKKNIEFSLIKKLENYFYFYFGWAITERTFIHTLNGVVCFVCYSEISKSMRLPVAFLE